ncbi:ATP-binding cassette domain-containing protein, partial [Mesorhizobium delmotii]|uniref:ATP-binding cassette domain-containing protein n=1 Tax=Mesorhizobium delmotii TaxID=1631247 RepID=UPI001FCF172C
MNTLHKLAPTPALLEVSGLSKWYGGQVGCLGVSFAIRPGEVLGIVGESGSGKSTLLSCLSGQMGPDTGSIIYDMKERGPVDTLSLSEPERRRLVRTDWGLVQQRGMALEWRLPPVVISVSDRWR